jgi:hypothetical protein
MSPANNSTNLYAHLMTPSQVLPSNFDALPAGFNLIAMLTGQPDTATNPREGHPYLPACPGLQLALDIRQSDHIQTCAEQIEAILAPNSLICLQLESSSVHDAPSSPRAIPQAADVVRQLSKHLAQLQTRIALLPSKRHWMSTPQDACRLAMRINLASVGVAIHIEDWKQTKLAHETAADIYRLVGPKLWALFKAKDHETSAPLHHLRAFQQAGFAGTVIHTP